MSMHPPRPRGPTLLAAAVGTALALTALVAAPTSAAKKPTCFGRAATIVGTARGEVIRGTAKADVIVAKGGHDRVFGGGGHDIVCGNGGNDRLVGGAGNDLLLGQLGKDLHVGQTGNDRLIGGPGDDGFDGGTGDDLCAQGTGTGPRANCERPSVPIVAPPPPPAGPQPTPPAGPQPIPLTGILAVAFSDLNGDHVYDTSDVLIAKLVDTSGNGQPGDGDTVEMGRYPLKLDATAFGDWSDTSHAVFGVASLPYPGIGVKAGANTFAWVRWPGFGEIFIESGGATSTFGDGWAVTVADSIDVMAVSPSAPQIPTTVSGSRPTDDAFIDVVLK